MPAGGYSLISAQLRDQIFIQVPFAALEVTAASINCMPLRPSLKVGTNELVASTLPLIISAMSEYKLANPSRKPSGWPAGIRVDILAEVLSVSIPRVRVCAGAPSGV